MKQMKNDLIKFNKTRHDLKFSIVDRLYFLYLCSQKNGSSIPQGRELLDYACDMNVTGRISNLKIMGINRRRLTFEVMSL